MIFLAINSLENDEDRKFIENLYAAYTPWLRCRAYKIVQDADVSQDLAHDCMVNMMKSIKTLKAIPESKQRSYLAVAIDNISKNYVKKASRTVMMKNDVSAGLDFIPDDCSIEDEIDRKYDYEAIRTNIVKLKDRDRDIIKMKYDLELDDQQIADVLQIKKDCVRMTVSRSVTKLKNQIKKQED